MGIKPCTQEVAIETYMEPVQHGLHLGDARSNTGLGVVQVSTQLDQAGLKAQGSRPEINSVSHAGDKLPSINEARDVVIVRASGQHLMRRRQHGPDYRSGRHGETGSSWFTAP